MKTTLSSGIILSVEMGGIEPPCNRVSPKFLQEIVCFIDFKWKKYKTDKTFFHSSFYISKDSEALIFQSPKILHQFSVMRHHRDWCRLGRSVSESKIVSSEIRRNCWLCFCDCAVCV